MAGPQPTRLTVVELSETLGPGGETDVDRFTVPVKPSRLETVIVEVAVEPETVVRLEGDAERAKSVVA